MRPEKRRRTRTTTASSSTEDVSTATNDGIELGAPDENYEEEEEYEEDEEDEEIMQHTQRDAENRAQKERERAAGVFFLNSMIITNIRSRIPLLQSNRSNSSISWY